MTAYTYITSDEISAETVTWTTARGDVSLSLLRNARLGVNGYLPASTHDIALALPSGLFGSYGGLVEDAEHGLCVSAGMGRIIIRVPAEHQAAARAIVAEMAAHNAAAHKTSDEAARDHAANTARVYKMMER